MPLDATCLSMAGVRAVPTDQAVRPAWGPPGAQTASTTQGRPILVLLSPAPAEETRTLSIAAEQASVWGGDIVLLRVLPGWALAADGSVSAAEAGARTHLDIAAAHLRGAGVRAAPLVRAGPVASAVADTAATQNVALLVIGTGEDGDGWRVGLARLFARRTVEAVARRAPCPVLLVRFSDSDARQTRRSSAPSPLRSFVEDAAVAGPVVPQATWERAIGVARIVGSVDRAAGLDEDFRPCAAPATGRGRLRPVQTAIERGAPPPPVEVYKLGYGYYVRDGHQRVAAARQAGQLWIDAVVTEFVPRGDADAQQVVTERRAFEQLTGLTSIDASRPGTYPRLEAYLRAHAARDGSLAVRDAAARWAARVFRPIRRQLRLLRAHEHCPGERSADLFLRVADYRHREGERRQHAVSWDEAVRCFTLTLRKRQHSRLQRAA